MNHQGDISKAMLHAELENHVEGKIAMAAEIWNMIILAGKITWYDFSVAWNIDKQIQTPYEQPGIQTQTVWDLFKYNS